jgi:hypothetical protein
MAISSTVGILLFSLRASVALHQRPASGAYFLYLVHLRMLDGEFIDGVRELGDRRRPPDI